MTLAVLRPPASTPPRCGCRPCGRRAVTSHVGDLPPCRREAGRLRGDGDVTSLSKFEGLRFVQYLTDQYTPLMASLSTRPASGWVRDAAFVTGPSD